MANANDTPETPQNPPVGPELVGPEMNRDARTWAMVCHLAGLAFLLPVSPVLGSVIGPLIVWLIKKDQYPFVDEQGKEAINFQITMLIYGIVAALLMFACIGFFLLPAVGIVDIVLVIVAAMKANDGQHYRYPYPLIFRFIK
jgi:uncharacterized Tic20 family protein